LAADDLCLHNVSQSWFSKFKGHSLGHVLSITTACRILTQCSFANDYEGRQLA